jgi:hypothetical protein
MMGTLDGNTHTNEEMSAHPDYIVRMLEDRDGDGVYDPSTVFAEHLTLPAGAVWYRNRLYVASPPDLLRFDSEGAGRRWLPAGTCPQTQPACTGRSSDRTDGCT